MALSVLHLRMGPLIYLGCLSTGDESTDDEQDEFADQQPLTSASIHAKML
ncbi:hypothetical protein IT774_14380 [Salinimonas marina]|uniref:Uncharacterized protein n=1 Tax=Salinimonas marina TaxID=2785918 RepID=A0A7S9DWS8_9ALTE|nr:hypothetical protein [Salinimonas marina]QPG05282.1 hypothetical protein IT774_14380 [Salinimonas marina]